MNVLVTGGAGYLGSVLLPKLLVRGHRVRLLDVGYFGMGHLRNVRPPIDLWRDDVRRLMTDPEFAAALLDGIDAVIHLAAVSNDPSAELNPELTIDVNHRATVALAEAARARGIRFVFSSSCSVYGDAEGAGELDERAPVRPLTTYAVSKVESERALTAMADDRWRPVILRNGTLFGYSPRMRFDLVVNIFSLYSTLYDEIKIFGSGEQWRPYLHVEDCARAFVFFVERHDNGHLVYNVSHTNKRVVDVEGMVREVNPRVRAERLDAAEPDTRDYRVTNARLTAEGFRTRREIVDGIEEISEAIVTGLIPDPESVYYRNAKWLKELTQLASKDHSDLLRFMETLSNMHLAGR